MMVEARDLVADGVYRLSQLEETPGESYYLLVPERRLTELVKRLRQKPVTKLTSEGQRTLLGALAAQRGEVVLLERRTRYTRESGERVESRSFVAAPLDYRFRRVRRAPGYTSRVIAKAEDSLDR